MAASLHSFAQRCCSSLSFFLWLPALMVLVVIHCGHYFIVTAILTLVRLLVCWCCNIYESVRSCNKFCLLAFQVFNFYYSIRQSARMNWAWCKRFNGGTNIEREREDSATKSGLYYTLIRFGCEPLSKLSCHFARLVSILSYRRCCPWFYGCHGC